MAILSGQPRRRRTILILIALISLMTIVPLVLFSSSNKITLSVIVGSLIWLLVGYDVYLYSLGYLGKRLIRGARLLLWFVVDYYVYVYLLGRYGKKLVEVTEQDGLAYLVSEGKLLRYNLILFGVGALWLVAFPFVLVALTHLSIPPEQNPILVGLIYLYLLFMGTVFLPLALMSFVYLVGESVIGIIHVLRYVSHRQFWIIVLLVWLTGGAFLLINTLAK